MCKENVVLRDKRDLRQEFALKKRKSKACLVILLSRLKENKRSSMFSIFVSKQHSSTEPVSDKRKALMPSSGVVP